MNAPSSTPFPSHPGQQYYQCILPYQSWHEFQQITIIVITNHIDSIINATHDTFVLVRGHEYANKLQSEGNSTLNLGQTIALHAVEN